MPILSAARALYLMHRVRHLVPVLWKGFPAVVYTVVQGERVAGAYDGHSSGPAEFFSERAARRRARELGPSAAVYRWSVCYKPEETK